MPRARKQQPRLKPSPSPIPAGLPEDRVEEEEARRIGEAVRAGQELLVQVTKAAVGDKGPRISTSAVMR